MGSNYPLDLFDPHGYRDCDYEDGIRRFNMQAHTRAAAAAAPPPALPTMSASASATSSAMHLPRVVSANALPTSLSATGGLCKSSSHSHSSVPSSTASSCSALSTLVTTSSTSVSRTITSSVTGRKRKSKFSDTSDPP